MRHLINILFVFIVVVIAGAFFLPSLIPPSAYRDQVQLAASDALHRDVSLRGDLSFSLLPRIEVRASDVVIANADGFGDEAFAQMGEMRIAVKLEPLLRRTVEIDEFVLVDPQINLSQRGARNNWTFTDASAASAPASSTGFIRQPGALPFETSFGDVRIENANILYSDGAQSHTISGLDMSIALPSLDDPVAIEGALSADGERLSFDGQLGSLRDFFEGYETPLSLSLGGALITAGFDGYIPAGEAVTLQGRVDARDIDVRRLMAFVGSPMPAGDNFRRFQASGLFSYRPDFIGLAETSLRLDDVAASGGFEVDLSGARPKLTGRLDLPELDVTPFLPEAEGGAAPASTELQPWSEEPIDVAGLHVMDTDITLTTDRLAYREIEVTDALLRVRITRGRLSANLNRFNLYGGSGSARIVANGRRDTPSFSLSAQLDALQALPFLTAAAGFERLEGTGMLNLELLTSGSNVADIMGGLSGTGAFDFRDGAIVGINIADTIRTVQASIASGALPSGVGSQEQTDFSNLEGSFAIAAGRATNQDFLMLSPLLRVDGGGVVDLPAQHVDYRLRPRAVASIQGQGGDRDMQGIVVPVRLRGPFNNVSVGVDTEAVGQALLSGVISNALGGSSNSNASPEELVRDGLLNALGLGSNDAPAEEGAEPAEEEEVDPAEALLRGLFARGRQSEPEPSQDDPED
jgi:AsmA protein